MIRKIALLAAASAFAATAVVAQTPPPGNVNPGSQKSGAEQSGAPNQPRSPGGEMRGTTGSGMSAPSAPSAGSAGSATSDGTNANVKPSSKESGAEPSGAPADNPRGDQKRP